MEALNLAQRTAQKNLFTPLLLSGTLCALWQAPPARAEDAEQLAVEKVEEKYWAQGQEAEMGVVQNRTYSKAGKFDLGVSFGPQFSDPFLTATNLGASLGYHLTEHWGVSILAFHYFVSASTALQTFEETRGATANTNKPFNYIGAEVTGSFLYGKLSFLSQSILYYDFYFLAGAGRTNTETGAPFTGSAGLGQRFYINKLLSVRVDYRLLVFNERIVERVVPNLLGQEVGQRVNFQHTISLGLNFLIPLF